MLSKVSIKGNVKWIFAAAALALFVLAGLDSRICIKSYSVDTEKLDASIRLALITDLHSCEYGDGQEELIEAVREQEPDIVMLGGDIFDDKIPDDNAEEFISAIAGVYPCFYVTGNHEYWSGKDAFDAKMSILDKYGVPVLSGETETVTINGENLIVCGADDPDSVMMGSDTEAAGLEHQLNSMGGMLREGTYTILLSHRPEEFELYASLGFDLVLSGHAHGGQWRIPGLLNGLYAPNQGFFPEYAGGTYEKDGTTMIVSRGLARESTRIPRFYNRPELVTVDIISQR